MLDNYHIINCEIISLLNMRFLRKERDTNMSKTEQMKTTPRLEDHFFTSIYVKRSEENTVMRKLNEIEKALINLGIHFSVGPNRNQGNKNFLACTLSVTIERDITSRGAGRRPKESGFSLEDIETFISQGKSPQEIAVEIGMSRATYYRHLAKAREIQASGKEATKILF